MHQHLKKNFSLSKSPPTFCGDLLPAFLDVRKGELYFVLQVMQKNQCFVPTYIEMNLQFNKQLKY